MKDKSVVLAYIAVCFFWGSTYLAIKVGIEYFPPFAFAGTRFIIAGAILLLYGKIKNYSMPKDIRSLMPMIVVGVLLLTGGNGLVTLAEKTVASGVASLFVAIVPIYIAVIEVVILKRVKLSLAGYLGMVLGLLGVYLLVDPSGGVINYGAFMLLAAGLLWSIGSVYSKKISQSVHIINNIGIQMLSGGLVLWFFSLIKQEQIYLDVSIKGYLALAYLVIFGSLIGYSSYIYILKKWPASKAGTYAYVNPVVAVFLGYIILGEPINSRMLLSIVVILVSVYIVQKSKMVVTQKGA